MRKKKPAQHAERTTANAINAIADDLGISNEEERARLQDWVPRVIDTFHMHKRDKLERLTVAQQIDFLSTFEKNMASFAKYWADGRVSSMMRLHERARVLGDEMLAFDKKVQLLDEFDQKVLDDAQGIASRIENVTCRVRAMKTVLQERTPHSVPSATQFAVHWLTEHCYEYWRRYLRHQKRGRERGADSGRRQFARNGRGPQLRFVASIFALAGHKLGDATIRTHLREARARRRPGRRRPSRVVPLSFDTQLEFRREFFIATIVDQFTRTRPDFKWGREYAELLWDDLLTGTYGLSPKVLGED